MSISYSSAVIQSGAMNLSHEMLTKLALAQILRG